MFPLSAVSTARSSLLSPPRLRQASSSTTTYRLKVFTLGMALFGLLAAYLVALMGSAAASGWLLVQIFSGGFTPLQGLGLSLGVGATTLLTFVLAKGLFRHSAVDRSEFIELDESSQPEFFAFLQDIYNRCGAPAPDRVFACPDVNAGVFVETSILDVFRPPRRNLLVGMGMVNALNRTELEAVLAHEFGHFSQRSMRLHDYVRVVTNILEEVIHGRDRIDLSIAGWHDGDAIRQGLVSPLNAATALVRRVAGALLAVIRRMEASLSRQMEFAADQVALELTGSDALIHALKRTDWADRCFSQTLYDLEQALSDEVRTDDLFYHQIRLGEAMRQRLGDPTLGIPPELPDDPTTYVPVFDDDDDHGLQRADQWASHPPHALREKMARQDYRRSTFDERSAWTLFSDPASLRRRVTDRVYASRWAADGKTIPAELVQRHLDGEHAEVILDGDDRIVYGHRFIEPGTLDEALAMAEQLRWNDDELTDVLCDLTGPGYRDALERIGRHLGSLVTPDGPEATSAPRPLRSPVTARAASAPPQQASAEEDHRWLADWDRRLLVATICAARRQGEATMVELVERYQFHLHLQDLVRWLRGQTPMLASIAAAVEEGGGVDGIHPDSIEPMVAALTTLHSGLQRGLTGSPPVPELYGICADSSLCSLVLPSSLVDSEPLHEGRLEDEWLAQFVDQWQSACTRIDHLRRKSLGALLLFQREIHHRHLEDTSRT